MAVLPLSRRIDNDHMMRFAEAGFPPLAGVIVPSPKRTASTLQDGVACAGLPSDNGERLNGLRRGTLGIFAPCAGVEPPEILLPAPVLDVHHRAERLFEPVPPDREDAVAVDDRLSRSADHRGDAPRP